MRAFGWGRFDMGKWRAVLDALSTTLITLGAVLVGYGIWRMAQPAFPIPQAHALGPAPIVQYSAPSLPASRPVSIAIPAIGVRARLAYTGLNADGSPAVPAGGYVDLPSWLTTSATPGENGTAVIIGHVDTAKSGPSIFYALDKLVPGDSVSVLRHDGRTAVFTVSDVKVYDKDAFPSALVYGRSAYASLRLITCTGTWDPLSGRYTQNLVVFGMLTTVR